MLRTLILASVFVIPVAPAAAELEAIPTRDVDLEVVAKDGVLLRGIVSLPDPENDPGGPRRWPVAILLTAQFRPRSALVPLADALARAGIASVMLDLRGQGDSMATREHKIYAGKFMSPKYLQLAAGDQEQVLETLRKLPELDLSRVALIGVGEGALVAASAAVSAPAVRALVMVDAAESFGGISAERDLGLFGARPVLLLCSGFPVSKERAAALAEYGLGERTVRCVGEFFNGAALLAEDRAGTAAISSWLTALLVPSPPGAPAGGTGAPPAARR